MSEKNFTEIAKKQDEIVSSVIGQKNMAGFEKAYLMSSAINELRLLLNDDYMKPIMALQGSRLGFKTDKDKTGGYDISVVRECLIQAVLMGVQPTGNQFNIIAGGAYVTREGFEYLLNKFTGLKYLVIPSIKLMSVEKKSALVESKIKWTLNGDSIEEIIEIPLKIDSYTSVDAVIGKAKRKSYAWLYPNITGEQITDGDVDDNLVISSRVVEEPQKEIFNDEDIADAILEIKAGNSTITSIQSKYELSEYQLSEIEKGSPK